MPSKKPRVTRSATRPRKPTRRERSSPKRTTYKSAEREVFARNVRAARLVMGWNQTELGYRITTVAGYVGLIERGKVNVSIDLMATIARTFGQPLYKFLEPSFTMPKRSKPLSPTEVMKSRENVTFELSSSRGRIPKAIEEREAFGKNLRAVRLAMGWSQDEVARRLGFTANTIPPTEAGRINIPIDRMAAFARLLESPLHRLLRPSVQ